MNAGVRKGVGIAAALLWAGAIWVAIDGIPATARRARPAPGGLTGFDQGSQKMVNQALAAGPRNSDVRSGFDSSSPFGNAATSAVRSRSGPVTRGGGAPTRRPQLRLKGVLIKDTPFAILEDEQGESHIVEVGARVEGQTVVEITPRQVRLRDYRGTYALVVAP